MSDWYKNRDPERGGWVYGVWDLREPDRVRYIGKTQVSVRERSMGHWYDAMRVPRKTNSRIASWLRKRDGEREYVLFQEMTFHPCLSELNQAEIDQIQRYRALGMADLNITDGGDGQRGVTATDETRRRMSEARRGEKHGMSKLTWGDVQRIRTTRMEAYVASSDLAQEYGVSVPTIERVLSGRGWMDDAYDPLRLCPPEGLNVAESNPHRLVDWDIVREIRSRRQSHWVSQSDLAREYGLKKSAVGYILANKTWVDPEFDPSTIVRYGK